MRLSTVKLGKLYHYDHYLWGCVPVRPIKIHHSTSRVDVEENTGVGFIVYQSIKPGLLHRPERCKGKKDKKRCENIR